MSQFKFGDRVTVEDLDGFALFVFEDPTDAYVFWPGLRCLSAYQKSSVSHATEAPATPPTNPAPSDEIDTKIIGIINQLRQSMRHWIGAMLDISVPQHGLGETNRIYHTANELEQRLVDYLDLLTANIASRQEGAACGS